MLLQLEQQLVSSFGQDKVLHQYDGDEVFALGACKHAAHLSSDVTSPTPASTVSGLSASIGIVDADGAFTTLVIKGTPLPFFYKDTFTVPEGQASVSLVRDRFCLC